MDMAVARLHTIVTECWRGIDPGTGCTVRILSLPGLTCDRIGLENGTPIRNVQPRIRTGRYGRGRMLNLMGTDLVRGCFDGS